QRGANRRYTPCKAWAKRINHIKTPAFLCAFHFSYSGISLHHAILTRHGEYGMLLSILQEQLNNLYMKACIKELMKEMG
ncbi:MAG: hypothetical protein RR340_05445, partial [Cloacibacillus sp.]